MGALVECLTNSAKFGILSSMRKTKLGLVEVDIKGKRFWQIVMPKPGGGRIRRTFKNKREAETAYEQAKVAFENHGRAVFNISEGLRVEALECARQLKEFNATLTEATRFYVQHLRTVSSSKPVSEVVTDLLTARKDDGMSERYLGDLRVRLARFTAVFGEKPIAAVTAAEIDEWLRALGVGAVTRNTFRRRLSTLFEFARKRGLLRESPLREVEKAKERSGETRILTPGQVAKLLEEAHEETLPYWAIAIFGGLRAAEIQRLTWDAIDLHEKTITVTAGTAKTGSRRVVPMADNLVGWLAPYASRKGHVCPPGLRKRLEEDRRQAGLFEGWSENLCRHSFGSYRLSLLGDVGRVAGEMGNSPTIVHKHYKSLVRPSDTKAFWEIKPETSGNLLQIAV